MKDTPVIFQDVDFSYEGAVKTLFRNLSFHLGTGWTGVVGPNGSGKSTLIVGSLNVEEAQVTYLPQEVDTRASREILDRIRGLPGKPLGRIMTVVSCPGWRPTRLLDSDEPSPGKVRKLLLAEGIARVPHIIIMDEPTNHLDLPSMECMEEALAGCPAGLLLVSHDERILGALVNKRLHISEQETDRGRYVLNKWGGFAPA